MRKRIKINLADLSLFGNDAAEDEPLGVFSNYIHSSHDSFKEFKRSNRRLLIARAYKGEGKTALLRHTFEQLNNKHNVCIFQNGSKFPEFKGNNSMDAWLGFWRNQLYKLISEEIGMRIGIALNPDKMAAHEDSIRAGKSQRNIIRFFTDTFSPKISLGSLSVEPEYSHMTSTNHSTQRILNGEETVWLFIDDIDIEFRNDSYHKNKIASFFTILRELVRDVDNLNIRSTIRPNVWTILHFDYEQMSHVQQYCRNIIWGEWDFEHLLANRILGYIKRTGQLAEFESSRKQLFPKTRKQLVLLSIIFPPTVRWGQEDEKPIHAVLYKLSKERPRWVVELCRLAAQKAELDDLALVAYSDIASTMKSFGERRIADTVAEFKSQCRYIDEIIYSFSHQNESFTTEELVAHIKNRILNHVPVKINNINRIASPLEVADLLYQLGFIFAREELPNGQYQHISYIEQPKLLLARTYQIKCLWEVHPVFRQALDMRDEYGLTQRQRVRRY